MRLEERQKRKLKTSIHLFYLVLALAPLLVAASYTWFSISRTPKVSEMGLSVSSGTGLELAFAPEGEEWTQYLDFRKQIDEAVQLKPVTWSQKEQCFYAAEFGEDGRITGISERLSDGANTNNTGSNGYYMKKTCYARTGQPVTVSLAPAMVHGDGTKGAGTYCIGTPIWNSGSVSHDNGGHGAEYAIRVGILITRYEQSTNQRIEESVFYIYEPNSDRHVSEAEGVIPTASIDGTEELLPTGQLIRQTTSTWSETSPVQKDIVIRDLGEFTTDTKLFDLAAEEYARIDIYVWLEGQDVDCSNAIGEEAQIFVNLQFDAKGKNQSGLEEIEP